MVRQLHMAEYTWPETYTYSIEELNTRDKLQDNGCVDCGPVQNIKYYEIVL